MIVIFFVRLFLYPSIYNFFKDSNLVFGCEFVEQVNPLDQFFHDVNAQPYKYFLHMSYFVKYQANIDDHSMFVNFTKNNQNIFMLLLKLKVFIRLVYLIALSLFMHQGTIIHGFDKTSYLNVKQCGVN